jgi:3-deoxy-7-phosphoheptulonate synthase
MSDGAQSLYPEQLSKLVAQLRLLAPVVGRSLA